mmetsp:Transcript_98412/g.263055  ORF Transcript_98412/g.263055 Transcript_98412/m.263055 type:complete len:89 (+) Transcript_98412:131-397(+)
MVGRLRVLGLCTQQAYEADVHFGVEKWELDREPGVGAPRDPKKEAGAVLDCGVCAGLHPDPELSRLAILSRTLDRTMPPSLDFERVHW